MLKQDRLGGGINVHRQIPNRLALVGFLRLFILMSHHADPWQLAGETNLMWCPVTMVRQELSRKITCSMAEFQLLWDILTLSTGPRPREMGSMLSLLTNITQSAGMTVLRHVHTHLIMGYIKEITPRR